MSKKYVIGIDLGTTNSCLSVVQGGEPVVIQNAEGRRTTPSIVGFLKDGDRKVGDPAKRQAVTNPEGTVFSIKRFIGKNYTSCTSEVSRVPYKVVDNNGVPSVAIGDRKYTPQEISAMVLQKLKKTAEDFLGQEVTDAVITVPAYFNDSERNATKEAGQIAGLNVLRIINEPTAAALAYGLDKKDKEQKIIVFDLGGGTFDVSVLEIGDGVFEVKSTDGDTHLGGDDFDNVIIDWMVKSFKDDQGVDLSKDPMALQRLKEAAEKAKVELSSSSQSELNLPYITVRDNVPLHFVKTLTRAEFERMISSYVDRTIECCKSALKNANLNASDIDEVILVGGSTRVPLVQETVEKFFNKKANKSVNPDEVVAIGASIQGAVLSGDITDVLLLDVIPLSLGIETMGGVFTKMIEANTTIPTRKKEVFSTAQDSQSSVDIHVLQGERPLAKDNKSLGKFNLGGILPAPRGVPQIEVTFDVDANGILTVTSEDKATGKKNNITISGGSQLSKEEVERMKQEAEQFAEQDRIEKEKIDTFNSADSMIFQTEKQLKEFEDKLSESDKTTLEDKLKTLKEAFDAKDVDKVKTRLAELNSTWNEVSTRLYETASSQNENPGGPDTEDVSFEEVNS